MILQTTSSESMDSADEFNDQIDYHPEQKSDGLNSPTDVRSYRHQHKEEREEKFNSSLHRLGDLPIVQEGSILDEEDDNIILMNGGSRHYSGDEDDMSEYDEEMRTTYLEYEIEQEELRREMNINKIAFAAYRGAVLHLVHNQASFGRIMKQSEGKKKKVSKTKENGADEEEFFDAGEVLPISQSKSIDTVGTEEEANIRMNVLEELARDIVETKAKACFEAVEVAKDFDEFRKEKRQRQRMLLGGLSGIGGQDCMVSELRKMKKKVVKTPPNKPQEAKKNDNVKPKANMKAPVSKSPPKDKRVQKNESVKKTAPSGPNVRLQKKLLRHTDCIKAALPKFQFEEESNDNEAADNRLSSRSAKYRTTMWIRDMARWRIQRRQYQEVILTKCSCPDCLVELKSLYDKEISLVKQ